MFQNSVHGFKSYKGLPQSFISLNYLSIVRNKDNTHTKPHLSKHWTKRKIEIRQHLFILLSSFDRVEFFGQFVENSFWWRRFMKLIFGACEEQFAILWACFLFWKVLDWSQNLYISCPSSAKFVKPFHIRDNWKI